MSMFPSLIQDELVRFCNRIAASQADTIVVMARKAVCLVQILIQQGMIPQEITTKTIVSNRIFDLDNHQCNLGKVAIVDDVIISGSTIAKTIHKINELGVVDEDIEIIVLAVNDDSFNPDFFKLKDTAKHLLVKGTYAEISVAECLQLCTNISCSLSLMCYLYDIDYPHYASIVLADNNALEAVVDPSRWNSYDNTNVNHSRSGATCLTVLPTALCKEAFDDFLNFSIAEKIHFKIRMIIKQNGNEFYVKCVPMVLFREISHTEIEAIFNMVCGSREERRWFNSDSSKFRLLQFLFAHLLMGFFCKHSAIELPAIERSSISLIFGAERVNFIIDMINNSFERHSLDLSIYEPDLLGYSNNRPNYENSIDCEYDINAEINEPFFKWFKDSESQARRALKEEHYSAITDASQYSRLDTGFSINAITSYVSRYQDKYKIEDIVSCFIDRAVDYGTIVPIIYENDGILCRAFRHGEDYEFTEEDRDKLQYFYKEFFKRIGYGDVTQLEFFKIVALFLHMGESSDIINKFYGFKNDSQLLSIQYCIHGAVPVVIYPNIEDANIHTYVQQNYYAEWLTRREMRESNLVVYKQEYTDPANPNNTKHTTTLVKPDRVVIDKDIFNTIDSTGKAKIDEIAELLVPLYIRFASKRKKSMLQKYLIALTACLNSETFVSAIMAEIRIGVLDWKNTVNKVITSQDEFRILSFAQNLRVNGSDEIENSSSAFTAINSGRKKSKWFYGIASEKQGENENDPKNVAEIIKFFSDEFEDMGSIYLTVWRKYWAQYEAIESSALPKNDEMIKCVGDIYTLNIAYRQFQQLVLVDSLEKTPTTELEVKRQQISRISMQIDELVSEFCLYRFPYTIPIAELKAETIDNLNLFMMAQCESMSARIQTVERYLSNKQMKFIRKYQSAIILDFVCTDNRFAFINDVDEAMRNECNVNYRIIPLEDVSEHYTRVLFVFNSNQDERRQEIALSLWARIDDVAHKHALTTRCTIIPKLPPKHEFEYNVLGINQKGIDKFARAIISIVEKKINMKYYYEGIILLESTDDARSNTYGIIRKTVMDRKKHYNRFGNSRSNDILVEDSDYRYTPIMFCKPVLTVGIITILDCETRAINSEFNLKKGFDPTGKTERLLYEGIIDYERYTLKVCHYQQLEPGGNGAIDAFHFLKDAFKPDFFMLCGIAGSFDEKKLKIGDVIIATAVIDGKAASEEADGIHYEAYSEKMHPRVTTIINSFFVDYADTEYSAHEGALHSSFRCMKDPIADNGHVIKDINSEFRIFAQKANRKVIAVETEASGVLFAFRTEGLSKDSSKGTFIIRGVSDAANVEKPTDNKWHTCASSHAAHIAKNLIPSIAEVHLQSPNK